MYNSKSLIHPATKNFVNTIGYNNILGFEINAINTLVWDLVRNKLWDLFYAIYPFVSRTATSHSYNLSNPSNFQIIWTGTVFHNEFGIKGDGATGWGNTILNVNTTTPDSLAFGVYNRSSGQDASGDIEATLDGIPDYVIWTRYTDNNAFGGNGSVYISSVNNDAFGFYVDSRVASNSHKLFKNGIQIGNTDTAAQGAFESARFGILDHATNPGTFSAHNLSFAFISQGLTDLQVKILSSIVNNYQIQLGRNMAEIEYLESTAEGSAASGNITLTAPSSPQINDVWIAIVHSSDQVTHSFTDWTELFQANGGGTTSHLSVWYFRYAGSTPNLIVTHTGGQSPIGGIAAFRGCKTNGSPANVVGTGGSGTGQTITMNSITTTIRNCMLLACEGCADDNNRTAPTSMAVAFEDSGAGTNNAYVTTAGNPDGSVALYYQIEKDIGATGNFTSDQGTPADPWTSVLIALEPST